VTGFWRKARAGLSRVEMGRETTDAEEDKRWSTELSGNGTRRDLVPLHEEVEGCAVGFRARGAGYEHQGRPGFTC